MKNPLYNKATNKATSGATGAGLIHFSAQTASEIIHKTHKQDINKQDIKHPHFNEKPAREYLIDYSLNSFSKSSQSFSQSSNSFAKSLFTRIATWIFCEEIVQAAQLCSFYFTWNMNTALACMLAGTNVFLGSMVPIAQQAFRDFINIVIENPKEPNLYRNPLLTFVIIFLSISCVHALNATLCKKLRDDLVFAMRGDLAKYWVETKANDKYLNTAAGQKIKDPLYDIVFTTKKFCLGLINLANARLSTLSHFFGALRALYLNSGFFELSFFGLTLEIPYLILVCFAYVYSYNLASSWANSIFKKNIEDENDTLNEFNKQLVKINSHNQINFDTTHDDELHYQKSNNRIHAINRRSLLPQFGLSFLNKINIDLSMLLGALVQLSTGIIDAISIAFTAQNFSLAASLASWKRTSLELLKNLENSTDRLQQLFDVIFELNLNPEESKSVIIDL